MNEIHTLLPNEDLIYFGDSAWCPYGTRPTQEIVDRVFAITDFLLQQGCQLIVIACNSATIQAVEALRTSYPIPFVGMEPGLKPAVSLTRSGTIGILATEASLAGEKFHTLVNTHSQGVKVITRPAPRFVELVEKGELTTPYAQQVVNEETHALTEAGADVIVLGCTHYPFLRPLIEQAVDDQVHVIDTGAAVAKQVAKIINSPAEKSSKTESHYIYTSGNLAEAKKIIPILCPNITAKIQQADI